MTEEKVLEMGEIINKKAYCHYVSQFVVYPLLMFGAKTRKNQIWGKKGRPNTPPPPRKFILIH